MSGVLKGRGASLKESLPSIIPHALLPTPTTPTHAPAHARVGGVVEVVGVHAERPADWLPQR